MPFSVRPGLFVEGGAEEGESWGEAGSEGREQPITPVPGNQAALRGATCRRRRADDN